MTEHESTWGTGYKYSDQHLSRTSFYVGNLIEPLKRSVDNFKEAVQDSKELSTWNQTHGVLNLRSRLMWTVNALAANPESIVQESEHQILHDAASLILDQAESKSVKSLWEDPEKIRNEIGQEVLAVDHYLGSNGFISLLSDRAVPLLSGWDRTQYTIAKASK